MKKSMNINVYANFRYKKQATTKHAKAFIEKYRLSSPDGRNFWAPITKFFSENTLGISKNNEEDFLFSLETNFNCDAIKAGVDFKLIKTINFLHHDQ
jgi:hypothetical protein